MKSFSSFSRFFAMAAALVIISLIVFTPAKAFADVKPYRVALVIGDQWHDPMSFLVKPEDKDFSYLAIMFKSWGVPFDVIRLDQEFMDINRFLDVDGKPSVGCILWAVPPGAQLQPQQFDVIRQAVNDYGISLIALCNRIEQPIIQELLGIKYIGSWLTSDDLKHQGSHFITAGLKDPLDYADSPTAYKQRIQVELAGATPIIMQGKYPQVTVRELPGGAKTVWIGGDIDKIFDYQELRSLIRRAVAWSIGYSLFKTWENKAWQEMDDPGTAQNAWLESWHYGALSEEQIIKYLIEPLKKNNAILIINIVPGFVNDELQRVEPSFQRTFVDKFGTSHDYPSVKRGVIKGIEAGVIEIQLHGLTHMQPDLWSPPGPWYGSELDRERAEVFWYHEFYDGRRGKEIPAAEAAWRMKTGKKWLEYQFGITPLSCVPGQGRVSTDTYENNTWRIAAMQGFGWHRNRRGGGYLGTDMAIQGTDEQEGYLGGTMENPALIRTIPDGHDKGVAEYPEMFAEVYTKYPDKQWMGVNEYVGYTHTEFTTLSNKDFHVEVAYDQHYCRYFKTRDSQWNLLISDWLAKELKGRTVTVDGKAVIENADLSQQLKVNIPAGVGSHTIAIK